MNCDLNRSPESPVSEAAAEIVVSGTGHVCQLIATELAFEHPLISVRQLKEVRQQSRFSSTQRQMTLPDRCRTETETSQSPVNNPSQPTKG
jgi:hypothetical protein